MDILLIDPPYTSLKGVPTDVGYNVGLTGLAAYLRQGGIETGVLMGDLLADLPAIDGWVASSLEDYASQQAGYRAITSNREHPIWKKLREYVKALSPRAVGISYLTPLKCSVDMVARAVKEVDPSIKVIVGGPHATFCPDETLASRDIDFAVMGEGEIPLLSLMKLLLTPGSDLSQVPGLCYRSGNEVRKNARPPLIDNLDELPFPARDLVMNCDYDLYRVHCLTTARGCPYACSFCADKGMWGGRVRRRSIESVIKELRLIKNAYKVDMVDFEDGTFTYDRKYVVALCEALMREKLDLRWGCMARYDNIDEDLLRIMKQSGCAGIFFGLESGSDSVLTNLMNKRTNAAQNISVSNMVYQSGIPSVTSVLIGLPDEREEDMQETLRVMKVVTTDILDVSSFVPLPGANLYNSMSVEEKTIDWSRVGYKSFDNYFSRCVPRETLLRHLKEAFQIADDLRRKTYLRQKGAAERA
jgi:anaerobic magnesium-protoporphyrin IX monomethyl ester cyclase